MPERLPIAEVPEPVWLRAVAHALDPQSSGDDHLVPSEDDLRGPDDAEAHDAAGALEGDPLDDALDGGRDALDELGLDTDVPFDAQEQDASDGGEPDVGADETGW